MPFYPFPVRFNKTHEYLCKFHASFNNLLIYSRLCLPCSFEATINCKLFQTKIRFLYTLVNDWNGLRFQPIRLKLIDYHAELLQPASTRHTTANSELPGWVDSSLIIATNIRVSSGPLLCRPDTSLMQPVTDGTE